MNEFKCGSSPLVFVLDSNIVESHSEGFRDFLPQTFRASKECGGLPFKWHVETLIMLSLIDSNTAHFPELIVTQRRYMYFFFFFFCCKSTKIMSWSHRKIDPPALSATIRQKSTWNVVFYSAMYDTWKKSTSDLSSEYMLVVLTCGPCRSIVPTQMDSASVVLSIPSSRSIHKSTTGSLASSQLVFVVRVAKSLITLWQAKINI